MGDYRRGRSVCAERRIARQVRVVAARHGFSRGGPTPSSLRSQAARGATGAEYRRPRDRFRHRAGAYPRLSFTAATDEERERCRPASRVLLPMEGGARPTPTPDARCGRGARRLASRRSSFRSSRIAIAPRCPTGRLAGLVLLVHSSGTLLRWRQLRFRANANVRCREERRGG